MQCGGRKYQSPLCYHFGNAQTNAVGHGAQRPHKNLQTHSISHRKQLQQHLQRNAKGYLLFQISQQTDRRSQQTTRRIKRLDINRQK